MKLKTVFLLAISFLISNTALAWGQTGHRTVGEIAEKHLTKKAKKHIKELLGTESLAISSTWMDDIKSDSSYDYANSWHWVTIPTGQTYKESEKNPDGDVVESIMRMINKLGSDTVSTSDKVIALKMLVHLVGDLHQPLHVGNGLDRGGNNNKVKWFRSGSNLHRIWDSEMIDQKQLSYTELALSVDVATQDQISQWQTGTVINWAEEAMTYRDQIYDTDNSESLSYDYMYKNWDLVQSQLNKAGIRLAGILNEIFG